MAIIFIFLKNERKHRRKTAELLNILPQSWKLSLGLLQFLKVFSTINILSIEVKKGISIPYPLLHNTIVCKKERGVTSFPLSRRCSILQKRPQPPLSQQWLPLVKRVWEKNHPLWVQLLGLQSCTFQSLLFPQYLQHRTGAEELVCQKELFLYGQDGSK